MQMEADAVEVVEAVEDINEMKKKIEKLEDMFKRIMTKVDQISQDVAELKPKSRKESILR